MRGVTSPSTSEMLRASLDFMPSLLKLVVLKSILNELPLSPENGINFLSLLCAFVHSVGSHCR